MIQCPNCNARLDDDAVFCGNCGKQVAPLQARGATVGYNKGAGMNDDATIQSIENLPRPGPMSRRRKREITQLLPIRLKLARCTRHHRQTPGASPPRA